MNEKRPLLVCIVGPTAIGKTKLAIELAKAFFTEIISADSRQFFKEMKIGTAVPSEEELKQVPHHFIQSKSIHEFYSVGDFERDVLALLNKLFKAHPVVIMVGGSGLYVDAITRGLDDFPEVPETIREILNEEFDTYGLAPLQNELREKDPVYFNEVDRQNPQRVIRALEVIRSSGKPFSSFRKNVPVSRPFDSLYIGLNAPRELVYKRINDRVNLMMNNGLLEEAEALYPYKNLNALQSVGYRELFDYFERNLTLEEAVEAIKRNTRRFAKRQQTWYRKNPQIQWFDYSTPIDSVLEHIKKALSNERTGL